MQYSESVLKNHNLNSICVTDCLRNEFKRPGSSLPGLFTVLYNYINVSW